MPTEPIPLGDAIGLLHDSAKHYDDKARSYLGKIDQLLTVTVSLVAIVVPILFGTRVYALGLFIPAIALFLLLFAANAAGEMFALAAHRFRVEEHLTALVRRSGIEHDFVYVPWETSGGKIRRRSMAYKVLQLGAMAVVAASMPAFAILLWITLPELRWATILSSIVSLALFSAVVAAYIDALRTYERTYSAILEFETRLHPAGPQYPDLMWPVI